MLSLLTMHAVAGFVGVATQLGITCLARQAYKAQCKYATVENAVKQTAEILLAWLCSLGDVLQTASSSDFWQDTALSSIAFDLCLCFCRSFHLLGAFGKHMGHRLAAVSFPI